MIQSGSTMLKSNRFPLGVLCLLFLTSELFAQQAPAIGYMYPSGGKAGTILEVVLGGYDWTPDMQVFVHNPHIKLEIIGPPGPVIVPEPPYWFGKKARRAPFLLPRETPARLTIPADVPSGIYRWQAANANGATATGRFVVGSDDEIIEVRGRKGPQKVLKLPATVSGRILKIEEVDSYRFIAEKSEPVTCHVVAPAIGSPLNAVIEVRDGAGKLVADKADTEGRDLSITFLAEKGKEYTVSIYDADFRGNRAFVYRLSIVPGPRIVSAIPAAGRQGETRQIEFIGYGLVSNSHQLESVSKNVSFPSDNIGETFEYVLETASGKTPLFSLLVTNLPETVEPAETELSKRTLSIPVALTGSLEQRSGEDRYLVSGKKGDVWAISLEAARINSPLDVSFRILDQEEKQLQQNDDLPGTTDAGLEYKLPADGDYQIVVSDISGKSRNRASTYRLAIEPATADYTLSVPELLNVTIGGKASLTVTAVRRGGFKEPIQMTLSGLPAGVSTATKLEIPAGKNSLKIDLDAPADVAATASLVTVFGSAEIDGRKIVRTAGQTLLATTIKPPFVVDAEGRDDVTKWPRGTTFPAPVLIEREEGFTGEIILEMSSKQGRHRQGIRGPELTVAPGVKRILYPVFLPEWLETTRTSRMVVNGVAKIPDPEGNVRYSVSRLKTRIGFLPGGALLKVSADVNEIEVIPGQSFEVPVTISRAIKLKDPALLELQLDGELEGILTANPITVEPDVKAAVLSITPLANDLATGEHKLTIRATVMQDGKLPVISETNVDVIFVDAR